MKLVKKRVETFSEIAIHNKFQSYMDNMASFSEDKKCSRWYVGKPQFSSTAGLGNKMKLKLMLLPFSIIWFWCLRVFCFLFCNLRPLSKCRYLYAGSMTRHSGSFQVLFLGLCPLSIDRKISLISLARYVISCQSYQRPILLPDMVSLGFSFKLIIIILWKWKQIFFFKGTLLQRLNFSCWQLYEHDPH